MLLIKQRGQLSLMVGLLDQGKQGLVLGYIKYTPDVVREYMDLEELLLLMLQVQGGGHHLMRRMRIYLGTKMTLEVMSLIKKMKMI